MSMSEAESKQRAHYDQISESYNNHYSDEWSIRYRDRFFHQPMFAGLDLRGKRVLDALCGYGDVTRYLVEQGAEVTGLDISPVQVEAYRQRWGCEGLARSILESGLPSESFDHVVVCSALHHMPPYLDATVEELLRLLKPGGQLSFVEPHSHSLLEKPRQWWYSYDPLFEENEEAVDVDTLVKTHSHRFSRMETMYRGSFAYLLVLNSLVFRLPVWTKKYYSPLMFWLESMVDRARLRPLTLYVLVRWTKA